jgi:hypothetical protein
MIKSLRLSIALFTLGGLGCILNSCQYQFGRGDLSERYSTIAIPYAEGDKEGRLTAEVIRRMSETGALRYVSSGGDLTLTMKLIELRDENIGFRYDRKKQGELKKTIIPTESRLSVVVEVSVSETCSGQVIRGPTRIKTSVDFDHDYYSSYRGINVFSLGQLNDYDAAHDAVMYPLNCHLAERIVDYVINSW